jgi:hypothetical protein
MRVADVAILAPRGAHAVLDGECNVGRFAGGSNAVAAFTTSNG